MRAVVVAGRAGGRRSEIGVSVSIMKESVFERFPKTVEAAAEKILKGMSFQDKTRIANMGPKKLVEFHRTYGGSIQVEFRLPGNDPLMKIMCRNGRTSRADGGPGVLHHSESAVGEIADIQCVKGG